MATIACHAIDFELFPYKGIAFDHLSPLIAKLRKVCFSLEVRDPSVNQGQQTSTFDDVLQHELTTLGAELCTLPLPPDIPQEMDFAFRFNGKRIAVEVEKANREKILRDILKGHMYLHAGADFALVGLPLNYPHKHGVWDLFDFGKKRFAECQRFGFGKPELLDRILLLGFKQIETETNQLLSSAFRERIRSARKG